MTDNMRIWDAVSKTDPANTKRVNQRGGFTAIGAHSQIMEATRQFGPIGIGWGYTASQPIVIGETVTVGVTIWHGDRNNAYGPVWGGADLCDSRGKPDSDAPKKAETDGLTKGLSQLGFNADVFLGRFDDNKYVEQMRQEFAAHNDESGGPEKGNGRQKLAGPYTSKTALWQAVRAFDRELRSCGDIDTFEALLATDDTRALIKQVERDAPQLMGGGDTLPPEFEPIRALISKMRTDLTALAEEDDQLVRRYRSG